MTPQNFFVVTNQVGQYLQMIYYPSEDAFYSSWEELTHATYFKTEKEAVEQALIEEDLRKEVTNISSVQIHMQHTEKTTEIAKRFQEEKHKKILNHVMKKVPVTRGELEEVFEIVMEGKGKLIGTKEMKREKMNILFEEKSSDQWVVKHKNIPL